MTDNIDKQQFPVYVSYAWKDGSETVDKIAQKLPKHIPLIRDKDFLAPGDWISEFMKAIGRGELVLVVLSVGYLQSAFCMQELLYLYQSSLQDKKYFLNRVVPVVLGNLKFGELNDRKPYIRYWIDKEKELQDNIDELGIANIGKSGRAEHKLIKEFREHTSDMLEMLSDTLIPSDKEAGIEAAISLISQRSERITKSSVKLNLPTTKEEPPDYRLCLLNKESQSEYIVSKIPEDVCCSRQAKTWSFLLTGPRNEWPTALPFKIAEAVKMNLIIPVDFPTETKELARQQIFLKGNGYECYLLKLLAHNMNVDANGRHYSPTSATANRPAVCV